MPKLSPVSYKRLAKVFEGAGYTCTRIEGDHLIFTKPGSIRTTFAPLAYSEKNTLTCSASVNHATITL